MQRCILYSFIRVRVSRQASTQYVDILSKDIFRTSNLLFAPIEHSLREPNFVLINLRSFESYHLRQKGCLTVNQAFFLRSRAPSIASFSQLIVNSVNFSSGFRINLSLLAFTEACLIEAPLVFTYSLSLIKERLNYDVTALTGSLPGVVSPVLLVSIVCTWC